MWHFTRRFAQLWGFKCDNSSASGFLRTLVTWATRVYRPTETFIHLVSSRNTDHSPQVASRLVILIGIMYLISPPNITNSDIRVNEQVHSIYNSGNAKTSLPRYDVVIKWKHFPRRWPFVRGIHRSAVNSHTKASDAELWYFLWSAPEPTVEQTMGDPVLIMTSL